MAAIELIGLCATVIAVVGVILNNHRLRLCFSFWLVSNSLTLFVHLAVGVWSLAARDAVFLLLAVDGLRRWHKETQNAGSREALHCARKPVE